MEAREGVVTQPGRGSVEETVEALKSLLKERGIRLFCLIDHSGEAEKAGMAMPPTKLLIFGSPTAGTPVMLAAPTIALDLPLKLLVWQDGEGKVWISFNSAEYLGERHQVPEALRKALGASALLAQAVQPE